MAKLIRRAGSRVWYEDTVDAVRTRILKGPPERGQAVPFHLQYRRSRRLLGNYVTLDYLHASDVKEVVTKISEYAEDHSRPRPLNVLMLAEPGSGKSHLVKALAAQMTIGKAEAVTYNMAALQRLEDLSQPLESVRNLKVLDKFPILFLDEIDSQPTFFSVLLPLLWDGELHVGHTDLKLGKLVIILAASTQAFRDVRKKARTMEPQTDHPPPSTDGFENKIVDLLSRINGGVLEIPPLDLNKGKRDRRVDKVCIAVALLESRFGNVLELVPWTLLHFIGLASFRYGFRSIAHLIDLLPPLQKDKTSLELSELDLPFADEKQLRNSSLAYHLVSEDGPESILDLWRESAKHNNLVRIQPEPENQEE